MQTLTSILIATDFSKLSTNAFHAAYALAGAHGARLILLYVKQPEETVQGEFGLMPPFPQETNDELLERLAELVPADPSVQVERLVAIGRPADAIVQVARKEHCDLIVMGTHDRHGLARFFDGNIADSVTRSAPCPVLALRSAQTEVAEPVLGGAAHGHNPMSSP